MNSKIHVNLAFMLLLALVLVGSSSAQGNIAFAISDPNAAGASSKDGYTINVDLPQAVLHDVTISDTLPQGLIYKGDSLEVIGTVNLPSETVSSPNDGSKPVIMTWTFVQLDKSDGQGLTLKFQPIVANVTSNRAGITLAANQVSLQYKDDSGDVQTASGVSDTATLVEPDLEIGLKASPVKGKAPTTATYTASVSHSAKSDSNAFDSDLIIVLPPGIVYSPGSAKILSGPAGGTVDESPSKLKWHLDQIDRAWNSAQKVLLSFNATTVKSTISGNSPGDSPGEIHAYLTWKSAPGDGPGTRSYIKYQSIKAANYASDYAVSVGQIADPNPVEAGKILQYSINYSNTGNGDVHGVTIRDSYDRNVTFLSSVPMASSGKGDSWTVGDLKSGESGHIIVEARVDSSAANGSILKNVVNMASLEASSEAIAETTVKGIPSNHTIATNNTIPQPGENNTSSIQTGNNSENNTTIDLKKLIILPLIGGNNTTSVQIGNNSFNNTTITVIKIEDLPLVGANNTSSSTQIVGISENNTTTATTKLILLPLSEVNNESPAQLGNDSGNSTASTPANREIVQQVMTTNETTKQLQAQTGDKTTSIPEEQDTPSQIGSQAYTYKQIGTISENDTTSASAIKAVPPQEATKKAETQTNTKSEDEKTTTLLFGDDIKVELVLQKTHLFNDYLVINKSADISNKPYTETNKPGPAKSQTKLGANQSNESIDRMPVATNKSGLLTDTPDAISNKTTPSDNQSDQSKGQTPSIEIKPERDINQTNIASNQPKIETNQSTEPDDKTPAVEIKPVLPAVQPGAASNQTETAPIQSPKPEGQTPIEDTKPTSQANKPNAVPTQPDVGASTPDTSTGQKPVVESNPAAPASQPDTGSTPSDVGAGTPDTSTGQKPVVESMPAVPASKPNVDLNQTK